MAQRVKANWYSFIVYCYYIAIAKWLIARIHSIMYIIELICKAIMAFTSNYACGVQCMHVTQYMMRKHPSTYINIQTCMICMPAFTMCMYIYVLYVCICVYTQMHAYYGSKSSDKQMVYVCRYMQEFLQVIVNET